MDNETLLLLANFKMLARKALGKSISVEQLLENRDYARNVLSEAEDLGSDELLLVVLKLKNKLGLLKEPAVAPQPAAAKAVEKPEKPNKYVWGVR